MPDPTKPDPGTGTKPEDATGTAAPNGVTVEQFGQIAERVDKMEKAQNQFFAFMRTQSGKPTESTRTQPANDDEPATTKARVEKLERELRTEREGKAEQLRKSAIREAISSFDLDHDAVDLLESEVHFRHGSAIKVKGEGVSYENPSTGEESTVKEFVAGLLKTKGDRFKPPAQVPQTRGMRGGGTSTPKGFVPYHELSPEERGKLTPAQRDEYARQAWRTRAS
mgnify:CR=1 FL=1